MSIQRVLIYSVILLGLLACRKEVDKKEVPASVTGEKIPIEYAKGLEITAFDQYTLLTVKNPWPGADRSYRYLLYQENAELPSDLRYDQKIKIPVEEVVVSSTTHLPSLEVLEEVNSLVGFPGLQFISSETVRKRIAEGKVQELGSNEALQTETLLKLSPDVVVSFSVDGSNKSLETISRSGIPVIFNADWTETSPLGKAEWIKFFGALYGKLPQATDFFEDVEKNYQQAKLLAKKADSRPSVLSGSMYKDQWFLPAGDSWNANFIEDANANYLFSEYPGSGSLSLSIEKVLSEAAGADFWIGPAQFTSYEQMLQASPHYSRFEAFQRKQVYTFSSRKGATGGVIFYESAPNRPDLVLKDLIHILHPGLLPDYELSFYQPLE